MVDRLRTEVDGIGYVQIGVAGSYDARSGIIHHVDVPGWGRPGLVAELGERIGLRVAVDNDVNLAAVAERRRGVAADAEGFALLWLGEGLGLAIDLGGTLLRGARTGDRSPVGVAAPQQRTVAGVVRLDCAAHHQDDGVPGDRGRRRLPTDPFRPRRRGSADRDGLREPAVHLVASARQRVPPGHERVRDGERDDTDDAERRLEPSDGPPLSHAARLTTPADGTT